jgi:hypothetical protein
MSASLRAGFDGHVTGTVDVQTVTLDTYLATHGITGPIVMKVDVEGNEEALFRGMPDTLADAKPDIITEVTLRYGRDTVDQLARAGYRFFQITDRGFIESPALLPVVRDRFVFLNYLLTTKTGAQVEAIFLRLQPAIRKIDLTQTSKYLSPDELKTFVTRMNEADQTARAVPSLPQPRAVHAV